MMLLCLTNLKAAIFDLSHCGDAQIRLACPRLTDVTDCSVRARTRRTLASQKMEPDISPQRAKNKAADNKNGPRKCSNSSHDTKQL